MEFKVFSASIFLSCSPYFHRVFFQITKIFFNNFSSIVTRFSSITNPYFDPCVKNSLFFLKKVQTLGVNNSVIQCIRNAKFLEYRFKRAGIYLGRFSNALVHRFKTFIFCWMEIDILKRNKNCIITLKVK